MMAGVWDHVVAMLVGCGLLLLLVGVGGGPVVQTETRTASCVYDNATYGAGERFQPESCLTCHCPHHGGRARCVVQDCRRDPACVRRDYTHEPCCGTCTQTGCLHSDGKAYPPGATVSTSACQTCTCPEGGGRTVCRGPRCPGTHCVDPVRHPGECCDSCPNGDNCYLDDQVIPAGQVFKVGSCKSCTCPPNWAPNWIKGRHLRAICVTTCKV